METEKQVKATIMDDAALGRALTRIAHEILERNRGAENVALIGIRRRGVPLAALIAEKMTAIEGTAPAVGEGDITFYRDDLSTVAPDPVVSTTEVDFSLIGKTVILVDDVIYTCRTARAALDAVMALGRPARVQLAVLIDRGHSELPIRPNFVGKNIPTAKNEIISVRLEEIDGENCVELYTAGGEQ